MQIYPTIGLLNGRCVSLFRGRIAQPSIWHVDPVKTAERFAEAGSPWLNIVDYDAIDGRDGNADLVAEIIMKCGCPVQVGGGIRTLDQVTRWLDKGAGRVVIGTTAVLSPNIFKAMAKHHPDQMVLAVDVFQGRVVTHGWRESSLLEPDTFIKHFDRDPLAAVMISDIDAKIEDAEDSLAVIARLAGQTPHPVIAQGLARNIDDIGRLKYIPNIEGVVVGRAFFDRSLDLAEVIELGEERPEPVAPFI